MDEISEQQRKEENEDLAARPAASHPAVQLSCTLVWPTAELRRTEGRGRHYGQRSRN